MHGWNQFTLYFAQVRSTDYDIHHGSLRPYPGGPQKGEAQDGTLGRELAKYLLPHLRSIWRKWRGTLLMPFLLVNGFIGGPDEMASPEPFLGGTSTRGKALKISRGKKQVRPVAILCVARRVGKKSFQYYAYSCSRVSCQQINKTVVRRLSFTTWSSCDSQAFASGPSAFVFAWNANEGCLTILDELRGKYGGVPPCWRPRLNVGPSWRSI